MLPGEGPYCPYCQRAHREWRENPATFDIQEHGLRCKPGVADQHEARVSLEAHPVCTCGGTPGRRCNRCLAKLSADDAVKEEVLARAAEREREP